MVTRLYFPCYLTRKSAEEIRQINVNYYRLQLLPISIDGNHKTRTKIVIEVCRLHVKCLYSLSDIKLFLSKP